MNTEIRSVFEGLTPAKCWGHYDERHSACTTKCKVSQFCKPVTARRKSGQIPAPVMPPQPEKIEPIAEPNPFDYFLNLIRGKLDVAHNKEMSNDVRDLYIVSNNGNLVMKIVFALDGSNKAMVKSAKGTNMFVIDSLEAAEKACKQL